MADSKPAKKPMGRPRMAPRDRRVTCSVTMSVIAWNKLDKLCGAKKARGVGIEGLLGV